MAINVLLVDDEKLEQVLIKKGYDWGANGFEIIGEANSGKEALEYARMEKPDIVITDISMPQMDGLELSEKLLEINPDCYIVIVTGYREFDCAQRAVKIGVEDFLLKPIDMKEIAEITNKIKGKILDKRGVISEKDDFKERVKLRNRVVKNALEYVDGNLFNPDLSLKTVAAAIYVNESYLSRVFKKEMKMSLIEYITKSRIKTSIKLINTTDLRVYEIAEAVGFKDSHYFSVCFKKQTGITIKEFKNNKKAMAQI